MDGIHDVGGKLGFGPINITHDDPPFKEDWEGRMLGIARAISRPSDWNSDKFRHTREHEEPVRYLTRPYFDQWYKAYACMLVGSGVITIEELGSGVSNGKEATGLPTPMPPEKVATAKLAGASFARPYDGSPNHQVGDIVRARVMSPTGHCRLPAYVRGHSGQIVSYHGAHVVADASAHNEKVIEPLYTVRFQLSELFPERAGSTDRVHLDLWERHLEAIQ
ncbi:MAG: nitrile hydratase subunit beta [Hyphomicrobiaceae bacterium]